jgi:hypothetical protein
MTSDEGSVLKPVSRQVDGHRPHPLLTPEAVSVPIPEFRGPTSGPVGVDRSRVATVDPRSPGGWEVPVRLPDPRAARPRELADVVLAMALEAGRLQALFSGTPGDAEQRRAELVRADRAGDLATVWALAVPEVCAAYRVGVRTAADAADRGEDDTFSSLAALCAVLLGWLTWCGRLPFAVPAELPGGSDTLPFRCAVRGGDPARTAVAAYTEVLAAGR